MYAYIKGELTLALPTEVIVETNGIGYKIFIPTSAFSKLPQINKQTLLHTSYVVREQSQALYGFLSVAERDLFEILLGVSGIGPKLALSLIGHMTLNDLYQAVHEQQAAKLCKVPGIGKKTAERLLIELRDKLPESAGISELALPIPPDPKVQKIRDAMNALIHLGYNQNIAQKAIRQTLEDHPEEIDLASLITLSLKNV